MLILFGSKNYPFWFLCHLGDPIQPVHWRLRCNCHSIFVRKLSLRTQETSQSSSSLVSDKKERNFVLIFYICLLFPVPESVTSDDPVVDDVVTSHIMPAHSNLHTVWYFVSVDLSTTASKDRRTIHIRVLELEGIFHEIFEAKYICIMIIIIGISTDGAPRRIHDRLIISGYPSLPHREATL